MTRIPLMVAYGMGVDSTAMLVGLHNAGVRPDAILFADTGNEKQETYDYLPIIDRWLSEVGFPEVTVIRNEVTDFKHYPPYYSLGENCLTNGTLPSLAFGFKSCSLKWKVTPQNEWTEMWEPAIACWQSGEKVRKVIGYDASPKDRKRFAIALGVEDPQYDYGYPLIDWGWDREDCKEVIRRAGLPVPPKSACYFCPATKPEELHDFRRSYLRYIVIMEARAKPRLMGCWDQQQIDQYNAATYPKRIAKWEKGGRKGKKPQPYRVGDGTAGLWRRATKTKPAMMTDYIREAGLLPADEIDRLIADAPKMLLDRQEAFENGMHIPEWHDFIESFTPEDMDRELPCLGCLFVRLS